MIGTSGHAAPRFLIGTCGYSYPGVPPNGWSGVFYPKRRAKRVDELEYYALHFNSVEINSTFYRPPSAEMAKGWAERTPSGFVFAVKVWQKFTHPTQLGGEAMLTKEPWERFDSQDVERFSAGIQPLAEAGKLGPLLFQYPASFVCDATTLERLAVVLSPFEKYPKVVELRHHSWSDEPERFHEVLARYGAAWAFIDEPKFSTSVRQEIAADGVLSYIRLHGRNQQKWWKHQDAWERYDYFYAGENIRRLAARLKELAAKSPVTKFHVFFNNHARGQAVANALMLKGELDPEHSARAPRALIDAFPEIQAFVGGEDNGGPV